MRSDLLKVPFSVVQTTVIWKSVKQKGILAGGERGVALLNHIVWDCLCGLMWYLRYQLTQLPQYVLFGPLILHQH